MAYIFTEDSMFHYIYDFYNACEIPDGSTITHVYSDLFKTHTVRYTAPGTERQRLLIIHSEKGGPNTAYTFEPDTVYRYPDEYYAAFNIPPNSVIKHYTHPVMGRITIAYHEQGSDLVTGIDLMHEYGLGGNATYPSYTLMTDDDETPSDTPSSPDVVTTASSGVYVTNAAITSNSDEAATTLTVKGSYYAKAYYTADGGTTHFAVPFPYLAKEHVHVFYGGMERVFDFNENGDVVVPSNSIPTEGTVVEVRRVTPRDKCLVEHSDYRVLTAASLNLQDLQFLFLLQEDMDRLVDIAIGKGVGGGGGGGGTGGGGGFEWDGPGGELPYIDIDFDKIRDEILADIQKKIEEMRGQLGDNIKEMEERIQAGLDRLNQLGLDVYTNAGLVVDPETGTITLEAIRDLRDQFGLKFNDVYARLDAQDAAIAIGASSITADDILKRIRQLELNLDAANGVIDLRVSETVKKLKEELEAYITEGGLNIDVVKEKIVLDIQKYYLDGIIERLSGVELILDNAGHSIDASVTHYEGLIDDINLISMGLVELAEALANAEDKRRALEVDFQGKLAHAQSSLKAYIDENGDAVGESLRQLILSSQQDALAAYQQQIRGLQSSVQSYMNSVTTLQAQYQSQQATIQEIRQVAANAGKAVATAGLNLNVNGHTIGYKMSNDGKTGNIVFTADKFYIYNPANANQANPFYYNSAQRCLYLNGIKVNYADIVNLNAQVANIVDANIQKAKIKQAQIENLRVTGSMIVDGAVTTNKIAASAVSKMATLTTSGFLTASTRDTYTELTAARLTLSNIDPSSYLLGIYSYNIFITKPTNVNFMNSVAVRAYIGSNSTANYFTFDYYSGMKSGCIMTTGRATGTTAQLSLWAAPTTANTTVQISQVRAALFEFRR